nr:DUF2800 domain-containing protein [Canibacter zhuwentaonis]
MIDDLTRWADDIKEYALGRAISGKARSGFKLVEGRSNRKYTTPMPSPMPSSKLVLTHTSKSS